MSDTRPQGQPDEAMMDLLIKQVTEGLSPTEQRALDVLDSEVASAYLRDLERAAAALALAGTQDGQPLPAALGRRVAQQADEHFAVLSVARMAADAARAPARAASRHGGYGWLAAVACLVVAVFGWLRPPPIASVAVVAPPAQIAPLELSAAPTPAEERAALLAKTDSLKISLGATKDPAARGVTGDAVWDPATQRGFLHFVGLAANDPAVRQYQIWIFDAARDKRYPVDGGVFDVPANAAEVVIPIRATLMVHKPTAFAVTIEKPGGVVVSGLEHVVALGAAG
jgi:hypothetical protein